MQFLFEIIQWSMGWSDTTFSSLRKHIKKNLVRLRDTELPVERISYIFWPTKNIRDRVFGIELINGDFF